MTNNIQIKTYNQKYPITKPHFYILNKGLNSGKPQNEPFANSFTVSSKTKEESEQLYWLTFGLWRAKSFHPFLKGSVIPFLTINDCKSILKDALQKAEADKPTLKKSIKALRTLEEKQKQYLRNIQLIEEAKRIVFYRYARRR